MFGYRWINGYKIDIFGWDDVKEQIIYEINGKIRTAKRHYTRAALGHGNPFPRHPFRMVSNYFTEWKKSKL